MERVQPGIYHWIGRDAEVRAPVHSQYVESAGALIDPIVPEEGMAAFQALDVRPRQVLLTNRRHRRQADRFREAFDCVVRIDGRALLDGEDLEAELFEPGDEVAWGITAIGVCHALPEETLFHAAHGEGAAIFGHARAPRRRSDRPLAGRPARRPPGPAAAAVQGGVPRPAAAGLRRAPARPRRAGRERRKGGAAQAEEPTEYPELGPYA
jgi:hypothetical protein